MEKSNTEIYRENMMELGTAMFALFTGRILHDEQINMIKKSSDKEKILALEMVAAYNLKGQDYTNYCKNKRKIRDK